VRDRGIIVLIATKTPRTFVATIRSKCWWHPTPRRRMWLMKVELASFGEAADGDS